MTSLTIRKIPVPVAQAIRKRATASRSSLNKAAIRMLEEAVGCSETKKPALNHDLDWMFGLLNEGQAGSLRKSIAAQRNIDPELWK